MSLRLENKLQECLAELDAQHLRRKLRSVETPCAPQVILSGQARLAFCSNDYLGLANHPKVIAALVEGAQLYGVGSGASHLISGHSMAHHQLQEQLASFMAPHFEHCAALYFCSGYMANIGVLQALAAVGPETDIFCEALNHASLIDGVRLARAASKARIVVYPHGDIDALGQALVASSAANKIIVSDTVFSMDGELAPLPALLALAEQHDAWLMLDDAHGFGVLGSEGRGALEHFNLRSPHIVYVGTLGKAAGVGGAFVAASPSVIDWLLQKARTYIFSTAAAPALAHALSTSLSIIASEEGRQRRAHVQALVAQLRGACTDLPWSFLPSDTPIQPLVIGDNAAALRVAAALDAKGIWAPAIRPPTVAAGTARLRITLSAAHTQQQVEQLADALHQVAKCDA